MSPSLIGVQSALSCGRYHACSFCPVEANCSLDKKSHDSALINRRLDDIKNIVMVLSNKGGVGKSTIAANIAAELAITGFAVGLGDVDIHGPNAPRMFGLQGRRVKVEKAGILPPSRQLSDAGASLKVGSVDFFLETENTPVVWRDSYKYDYIQHLLGSFSWGELDYLVLDMPPGTGNELITSCDLLEGRQLVALLVTTPESVAQLDTKKAARFCEERGVPVVGVVENMSCLQCPQCGHEIEVFPQKTSEQLLASSPDLLILAQLPLSVELALSCERGEAYVVNHPETEITHSLRQVTGAIRTAVGEPGVVG